GGGGLAEGVVIRALLLQSLEHGEHTLLHKVPPAAPCQTKPCVGAGCPRSLARTLSQGDGGAGPSFAGGAVGGERRGTTSRRRHSLASYRQLKGASLSLRLAPLAGSPLGNTVSECEANDQSNCNFHHWEVAPS